MASSGRAHRAHRPSKSARQTIDEVLLANLMQRMEDRGEVFEHVAEYCVYLVLVYERTDGSRSAPTAHARLWAHTWARRGVRANRTCAPMSTERAIATDPS